MLFEDNLEICGLTKQINWFSKPEYSQETSSKFFLLDCHHILTNARIKCCKTGIPEAGIHRQPWVKLTKSEHGNVLSKALVEDLVDCQSYSFAQQTFSQKVEDAMRLNGDNNEAMSCRLIREWYTADPGIDVHERCKRRLALRQWLLKDVSLNKFPPPGAFIKGIPIVMNEGLLTNIDRRLQLFPFVKPGMYNIRSLGNLEAENLFGAFQDLDPKGSGVIRPDDIPSALSTSCEMLCYRFNKKQRISSPNKARVYPFHELLELQSITSSAETSNKVPFAEECVEKHAELKMQCPVTDVRNIAMAFDPNIVMPCQTSTDQMENKLEEILRQCKNASMCVFTPAELLDNECFSFSKRLLLMFSCIDTSFPSTQASKIAVSSTQIEVVTIGVCYRRKKVKHPQPCGNRQDETTNDMTDSTDYTAINYNEMTDINFSKINGNKQDKIKTHRELQGNTSSVEKSENNCNKYESLGTIRNSVEHIYESECVHGNQYQSLTNERKLDEHTYESTERVLYASMEHDLAQYQSLTNRSESDNHASTH
ncbi:unnamed protein product [Mytilus coruscus]|uniref:EF-hand domain-containing protein n=1 Tax=Mytilus coruscus TaxID=42192 RepID=A0A6J8BIN6_MYTCO|nr:unnamed protein product [Mytilus coruscus]